jgi:hypothetical protein
VNSSSPSVSVQSEALSRDADLDREKDLERLLTKELSFSDTTSGDLPRCLRFRDERDGDDPAKNEPSSSPDTVVAAVEFDLCENLKLLSAVEAVCVYVEDLLVVDFVRRWLFIDPEKKSPIEPPLRVEGNRVREMASNPNIDALDLAVGVGGLEFFPVRNWNNPNW